MARWAMSAGLYLLLTAASRGDGLWEQHPEQAVMMGALYFALLGFCELYGGFARVTPARAG